MTSEVSLPDVGRRLRAARLQCGLSQGTVARRAGIAASYVSRIETGKIQPSFRTVLRIQRALKLELEEILGPPEEHRGPCPVSAGGICMLDLILSEKDVARRPGAAKGEHYTPREVRLLHRVAIWIRHANPDRLRALEIVLEDLIQAEAIGNGSDREGVSGKQPATRTRPVGRRHELRRGP